MRVLEELRALGYSLFPEGQNIRYRFEGERLPPPEKVDPLFAELRKHKPEALAILLVQELERIFETTWSEIRTALPHGMIEHIRRKHPDLQAAIDQAEARLEEVWAAAIAGEGCVDEFRRALQAWAGLYRQVIFNHRPLATDECRKECDAGRKLCTKRATCLC